MIVSVKHIYRQSLVFVLMLACVLTGYSQLLQKTTKAGRPSMMFGGVIAEDDGFVVSGVTSNPIQPYYGRSVIGKMDNQGNFISVSYLYDSIAKVYGTFYNSLIKPSLGGYVFTGYTIDSIPRILFVKSSDDFQVQTFEYDSGDIYSMQGMYALEVEGAFYISGGMTISGKSDLMLAKMDSDGNRIWQRRYLTVPYTENATSLTKLNNGNLMIGSFRNNLVMGNEKANTWLLEVDTAGEIVRQWFDPNDSTYGAYGLRQTATGDFYFASQKKYFQTPTTSHPIGTIVKIDNQFNKVWQYEGDRSSPFTGLFDVEQLTDGNFVACGTRHIYGSDSTITSAWIVKLSSTGEELWSKEYSGSTAPNTRNFLNDIDVLPNGNLVAVGETRNGSEGQFGLLLVLDSNGCVIENCVVGIDDIEKKQSLKIYPNPATDRLTIELPEHSQSNKIYISSISGENIAIVDVAVGTTKVELNTASFPAGIYVTSMDNAKQKFIVIK